ncbi:trigger factor [Saxibacter everestensis]|uniref:Trigger factor n=1 Tax=Saxibacter everestensis TaxID=2909229 RepID=A0ABY8QYX2_9MICO|nr:trigger factor [Brevibacteriaceae bacterium ZFBP1038]
MKSAVETLNPTRVKLSVEVPFDELKPSIDKAYKSISEQIQVPGFRKGKVPTRIIDQRVGRPAVLQEAVNDGLDTFYRDAITENDLKPLGTPEVEVSEVPGLDGKDEGELKFTVEVDVRPEVTLPEYSSIRVEVDATEVTDEDVSKELDELRGRFGTLTPVERPAATDDFVSIDIAAEVDGEEVDTASGISYQVGAGTMLDGLDEALDGLSAGEETVFASKLAGGEHEGEEAQVRVTLQSVKVRELPEADDDFAQLASEFDTLEELKEDLRGQAAKAKTFEQGVAARDKVLEQLLEVTDIPVPESVVQAEVDRHLEGESRTDDEEHRSEVTAETEKSLRTQFVLDTIVEKEDVNVSQEELIEYLISAAQQYGMNPNEFAQAIDQGGQVPAMVAEVGRRKALAAVLEKATVVDTTGVPVDLSSFVRPAGAEATDDAPEAVDDEDGESDAVDPADVRL